MLCIFRSPEKTQIWSFILKIPMSYSVVYVFIDYEDYIAAMVLEESQGSDFIIPDTTTLPYTSGDSLNANTLTSGKIL